MSPIRKTEAAAIPAVSTNSQRGPLRSPALTTRKICQTANSVPTAQSRAGSAICAQVRSPPANTAIDTLPSPISSAIAAHTPR